MDWNSPFALGGGIQYQEDYEGEVDTVFLGCYKKDYAIRIGLYDENMDRNEDDEFNFRIRENGSQIYVTPEIRTIYYPRDSIMALSRQYFHYGEGKPKVLRKHGKPARLRQIVPSLFAGSLFFGIIGAAFLAFFRAGLFSILVHFVIHIFYGFGYLKGLDFTYP